MMPADHDAFVAGRYRVTGHLGEGGMGTVLRAVDTRTGRPVALKQLLLPSDRDTLDFKSLTREADILKSLNSPAIVHLMDYDFECPSPFLVFALVEGRTLEAILQRGRLGIDPALEISQQIAAAVGELHELKLLHRDLKPSNVIVGSADQVILLDLGLAKHFGAWRRAHEDVTVADDRVGTLGYMPPEMLLSPASWTPTYDVWSIGVILYEMLTGRPPFPVGNPNDRLRFFDLIRSGLCLPVTVLCREAPDQLDLLIKRLLDPDPAARPPNGAAVAQAILDLRRQSAAPAPALLGVPPSSKTPPVEAGGAAPSAIGVAPAQRSSRSRVPGLGSVRLVPPSASGAKGPLARPRPVAWRLVPLLAVPGIVAALVLGQWSHGAPSVAVSPVVSPRASAVRVADLGLSLDRSLSRVGDQLSERWLRRFAHEHRADVRLASRSSAAAARVAARLKWHLEQIGVLEPLNEFLRGSTAYFSDDSTPESVRWALRSRLCDVELIEYFCEEHHIPWPLPTKVSRCAGKWDEPVEPWRTDFTAMRSWVRCGSRDENRIFPSHPWTDRWHTDKPTKEQEVLFWFAMMRWKSGLVLGLLVDQHIRRVLYFRPPQRQLCAIKVHATELIDNLEHSTRGVPFEILSGQERAGSRAYIGTRLPGSLLNDVTSVEVSWLDIPVAALPFDPELTTRVCTILPPPNLVADPRLSTHD